MTNTLTPTASTVLTYGDTFTLDEFPAIVWRVIDTRQLDKAGDAYATRAEVRPVHADDPTATNIRDLVVKIGRAERKGVYVSLAIRRYGDADALRPWASCDTYQDRLTDAQSAKLEASFAALTFDLPMLTPAEIAEKLLDKADYAGWNGAREVTKNLPSSYNRDDETRAAVRAAFTPEAREAYIAAAIAAFEREARKELARY